MANCIIEEQNLYDIANAIRSKNGETSLYKPSQMSTKISELESSDSVNPNNPIIIYDYDGTIIHSYSKNDFLNLTEYPVAPTHEDIIFDEYNWSLNDAKTYLSTHNSLNIGAIYKTPNKETIIYLNVLEGINLNLKFYLNGSVTVDWGDGTTSNVSGSYATVTTTKTGLSGGLHKIKIIPNENDTFTRFSGTNNGADIVQGDDTGKSYINSIMKIVLGKVSLNGSAFRACRGLSEVVITNDCVFNSGATYIFGYTNTLTHLNFPKRFTETTSNMFDASGIKTISLPSTLTTIVGSTFTNSRIKKLTLSNSTTSFYMDALSSCSYIEEIEIPDNVTNLVQSLFSGCSSLRKLKLPTMTNFIANYTSLFSSCVSLREVEIPEQYTEICNNMFYNCYSLSYIKIPKNVTAFGTNFMANSNINTIDCRDLLQVPTLADTTMGYSTNYRIIVPDALYSDWIVANNWSTIATHIIKVSDL